MKFFPIIAIAILSAPQLLSARAEDNGNVYFGRRLEPRGKQIMHGVGQSFNLDDKKLVSTEPFRDYWKVIGKNKPLVFMTYTELRYDHAKFFKQLKDELDSYPDVCVIPQVGLTMVREGKTGFKYEADVAAGMFDRNIEDLCVSLKAFDRPVFIRIGFECNGIWNGYAPDTYKAAFRRIVQAWRKHGLENVAAVWCIEPGGDKDYMKWYPGDDVVDWWSLDLFSTEQFSDPISLSFVNDARSRRFPVMIGESTPRYLSVVTGEKSWNQWFVPYIRFMHTHEHVKAFCYISWDWSKFDIWKDWGDSRIDTNPLIRERFTAELAKPEYLHAMPKNDLRRVLSGQ